MNQSRRVAFILVVLLLPGLFYTACGGNPTNQEVQTTKTISSATPLLSPTPPPSTLSSPPLLSPTPLPTASPTPAPSVWLAPYLPARMVSTIKLPAGINRSDKPEGATLQLKVGNQDPTSHWIYALVAPFPTITDTVSADNLQGAWRGESRGPFPGQPLLMDQSTYGVLSAWWGIPASQAVKVLPTDELLTYAWDHHPAWAIVPFEALEPRWKVLEIDGQSPLRKEFNATNYVLTVPFSLNGLSKPASLVRSLSMMIPPTNRDPAKMTVLVMTGVTALVRATAAEMYLHGVLYPAQDISPWLRNADITHISNEIPFTPDCPLYTPNQTDLRFCTNPKYIALLEDVGTKVVELTGDHFGDQGPQAMLYTLDMYRQRGWLYYGGGANIEEARKPITLEDHGNKIAFIGCNAKGGGYATASETNPGATKCDFDYMHAQIRQLRDKGYLTIVTFQHEEYYSYKVLPQFQPDFTGMAEAGAVIVSGSQAHQPQNFEFFSGALIHYGLGNLFFDQYNFTPETNDAFIDRHIFYEGRFISTELLTIRFMDYARPRPMSPAEREKFLQVIFKASGW